LLDTLACLLLLLLLMHGPAGCHVGGGNIVQPSATLLSADLARNGVDTPGALYDIIYKGKGRMPGFGQECAPRVSGGMGYGSKRYGPHILVFGLYACLATVIHEWFTSVEHGCSTCAMPQPPTRELYLHTATHTGAVAAACVWLQGACTFGPRLSDEEVRDLATYVEQQAAAGWK
jgi:hypothetical protein